MNVIVIGAGVIGAACAYAPPSAGAPVPLTAQKVVEHVRLVTN